MTRKLHFAHLHLVVLSDNLPPLNLHKFLSFYCHFEETRVIINVHWLEFCLKSFYEFRMSFNGFCECACANLISKANFNLIDRTDFFICLHIMF